MTLFRSLAAALLLTSGLAAPTRAAEPVPLLPVTEYQLPNGLKVIFHRDTSDPVVAVVLAAHVGSARETPGRTGFAHMFEHLFFLDSENLGKGGLDRLSTRVGGSGANGNTSNDITIYAQAVPKDALEKMIWAEADKLGWFINTVTDAVLAKEKQVVKNEKREAVDNRPYGHVEEILVENLFPADHPYNWPVIGSLADLDAATLKDVRDFYAAWYRPENATLTIAGDFDPAQARAMIDRYFAEIPGKAQRTPRAAPRPAPLTASKRLVYEDKFAQLPDLTLAFPAAATADPDTAALFVLTALLTDGKDTPLTRTLVDEEKLTGEVSARVEDSELAGGMVIGVRAFEGVALDRVDAAIAKGLARFEANGIDPQALARAKIGVEKSLYNELDDVNGKAQLIARWEASTGRSDFVDVLLARLRAVSADDVMRVYRTYLKDRPRVAVSTVPVGGKGLALANSSPAAVVEEAVVANAEAPVDPGAEIARYTPTPSKIDRKAEPAFGASPVVTAPPIWSARLANGLAISGIAASELPVTRFELALDGGQLLDDPARPGAASLLARMLTRGTARLTPADFDKALKNLGADISVDAGEERIVLKGSTLTRNLAPTLALVEESLVTPRWDDQELLLAKAATIGEIQEARAKPQRIAARIASRLNHPGTVLAADPLGTETSVKALTMADLRAFHASNLSPATARLRIIGADAAITSSALAGLAARWTTPAPTIPVVARIAPPAKPTLSFYDIPDAKQSVIAFTGPGPRKADPDYYAATATNFLLGGGGFASRLTQQLRETKGYTYGVRSRFDGGRQTGSFGLASPVRSNVTLEAVDLARSITSDFGRTFTAQDLALTRASLTRARARAFETSDAKLALLADIGDFGRAADFIAADARALQALTVSQVEALAARYLDPARMHLIIVGDARTQKARLAALGLGEPVMFDAALLDGTRP